MFKKFLNLIVCFVLMLTVSVYADVIKGKVSYDVPQGFFGTWRVVSNLVDTNSPSNFRKKNIDIWNLSKNFDVINLSNPFSGATASVDVSYANSKTVKFSTKGNYDNKVLTDVVELNLNGDNFTGINTITLETISDVNKTVIKTAKATYTLKGDKIAGMSIGE